MGVVAYCTEDEVLVVSAEDESDFIKRTFGEDKRPIREYRRIELPPGEAFRAAIFQPRLVAGKLL
jgi:hypothetical protein